MRWHEILLRLGLAALFGMVIGLEREHRHRPAGIKTHILVCMGAALVSLIQVQMVLQTIAEIQIEPLLAQSLKTDYGRLGAQVISGIGFLGAGTILRDRGTIKGLTTAATLWLTACVGLAAGMGYYWMSGMAVLITMTVLIILKLFQNKVTKIADVTWLEVTMVDKPLAMEYINQYCATRSIAILGMEFLKLEECAGKTLAHTFAYKLSLPQNIILKDVLFQWQIEPHILSVGISRFEKE